MKFSYKKIGNAFRPIIPIEIEHDGKSISHSVLVDSGADVCIFDAEIGELLGLDIESGEKDNVAGITGVAEPYYFHEVVIKVGGWPYKIKAGFLRNFGKYGHGIVGQKGFFDIFVVKFDLLKGEVELKPRDFNK